MTDAADAVEWEGPVWRQIAGVWRFPNGLELMTDIAPASWVEERQRWWPERLAARDFVPGDFEAYIRIFHRAARTENNVGTKRWAQLAAERGGPRSTDPRRSSAERGRASRPS